MRRSIFLILRMGKLIPYGQTFHKCNKLELLQLPRTVNVHLCYIIVNGVLNSAQNYKFDHVLKVFFKENCLKTQIIDDVTRVNIL